MGVGWMKSWKLFEYDFTWLWLTFADVFFSVFELFFVLYSFKISKKKQQLSTLNTKYQKFTSTDDGFDVNLLQDEQSGILREM